MFFRSVDRGILQPAEFARLPEEFPADELARLTFEMQAPDGRIRHLKPSLELSETQPYHTRPSVKVGTHPAVWP